MRLPLAIAVLLLPLRALGEDGLEGLGERIVVHRGFDIASIPNLSLHVLKLPGLEPVARVGLDYDVNVRFKRLGSSLVFEAHAPNTRPRLVRLGRDFRFRRIAASDPALARARRSPAIQKVTLEGKARAILPDPEPPPGTKPDPKARPRNTGLPRIFPVSTAAPSLDGTQLYYSSPNPDLKSGFHVNIIAALELATGTLLAKTTLTAIGHKWGTIPPTFTAVHQIFATADGKLVVLAGCGAIHDDHEHVYDGGAKAKRAKRARRGKAGPE